MLLAYRNFVHRIWRNFHWYLPLLQIGIHSNKVSAIILKTNSSRLQVGSVAKILCNRLRFIIVDFKKFHPLRTVHLVIRLSRSPGSLISVSLVLIYRAAWSDRPIFSMFGVHNFLWIMEIVGTNKHRLLHKPLVGLGIMVSLIKILVRIHFTACNVVFCYSFLCKLLN